MRLFLFFSFIILLSGCTSIEVAKEINKVTTGIKKSVTNIIKNKEKPIEKEDPKKWKKDTHHLLILHGRRVCKSQNPSCDECSLNKLCSYNLVNNN